MCLIAFAWQAHAEYPLIVAANRDEFFERPTAQASWWPGGRVVAGRDLRAGGSWMGVTRDGRFAALTNHRDPSTVRPDAPSRGELVERFLIDRRPANAAIDAIAVDAKRFNGFNLLAAQWSPDPEHRAMWIVSSAGSAVRSIAPGVHGLSNARLDTPWPKVRAAIDRLRDASTSATSGDDLVARLFAMLADPTIATDDRLPQTGVSLETERALSAAFIRMPGYGTRATTVLLVDRDGEARFVERRCEPQATGVPLDPSIDERRFEFSIASAARAS